MQRKKTHIVRAQRLQSGPIIHQSINPSSSRPPVTPRRVEAGCCQPAPLSEPYMKVSLHTAQALIRPALPLRLTRGSADKKTYPPTHLAILGMQPKCAAAPVGNSSETHQPTGVGRHLLSQWVSVLQTLLPFQTRPTWAYPARYHWPWLFRSSQCCAPRPALR